MLGVRIALGLLATVSMSGTYTTIAELAKAQRTTIACVLLVVAWPLIVFGWTRVVAADRSAERRFVAHVALALGFAQLAVNGALDFWSPYENRFVTPWWQLVALVPFVLAPSMLAGSHRFVMRSAFGAAIRGAALLSTIALAAQIAAITWVLVCSRFDETRPADVAIVLGYGLDERRNARPPLVARVRHGAALYRRGLVGRLILTGGGDPRVTEADAMRMLAMRDGVPDDAILLEREARSTDENIVLSRALMKRHRLRTALIVSEPYHLPRAMTLARRAGIDARPSPSAWGFPEARHRTHWVAREARLVLLLLVR